MKCPYCSHPEFKVIDSRTTAEVSAIRRRRQCLRCGKRFTTFETIALPIQVHKRDGRYEEFQQQKLINGIEAACRHTSISHAQVIALAGEISQMLQQNQVRLITTRELGELVISHLQKMDPIAYIRYACVYRRFSDIDELMEAIQQIRPKDAT